MCNFIFLMDVYIFLFQAGAWPLGQTSITPFAVPQELEKSVQTVRNILVKYTTDYVCFDDNYLEIRRDVNFNHTSIS